MKKAVDLLIIGGGQAGYQTCASLRGGGYDGAILLACEEAEPPYQRPPLSKGYLTGEQGPEDLPFRSADFYDNHRIDSGLGDPVIELDLQARRATTQGGRAIDFRKLAIATGARPRLPALGGHDLDGVLTLRSHADARDLKTRLVGAESLVVIGAGFVGLEVAAAAVTLGCRVTVIEALDRVMARVTAPRISAFFQDLHRSRGVDLELGSGVARILGDAGAVVAVELAEGRRIAADLVVVGIGVSPCEEIAAAAGLPCRDGILVDARLNAGSPDFFALGDCARFARADAPGSLRLESVQNAADQAKSVAAALLGSPADYRTVPWFWTQQFGKKLQMAGLSQGHDSVVLRGRPEEEKFSAFYYLGERLIAVDSLDSPADHLAARLLLAEELNPPTELAADPSVRLKDWAKAQL